MDIDLADLVMDLWNVGKRRSDGANVVRMDVAFRTYLRSHGIASVPFGDGDEKTASPGTYRPVGRTCPASCPYLNAGCYAQGGNVALHQRDASAERQAALVGAAVVMVWAARTGRTARLHVSGDFGQELDVDYVSGLAIVGHAVQALSGRSVLAWTYTHHKQHGIRHVLADAGIVVRDSDVAGPHGAVVVADREHVRRLRAELGAPLAVCPAQLDKATTCASCQLCWTRPDVGIAFLAHGVERRKVARLVSTVDA